MSGAATVGFVSSPTTRFPENYKPAAGETVINPVIDCDEPVLIATEPLPAGIIVQNDDITIVNPNITECFTGILIRKNPTTGAVPDNIRIIADDTQAGYATTQLLFNRTGIAAQRVTNLEVGDISPSVQGGQGGALDINNSYHPFNGSGGIEARIHHLKVWCSPTCSQYTASGELQPPGAHWGIKWLADRSEGAPFEASEIRMDHNDVSGFDDEGISFDSQGGTPDKATIVEEGDVFKRSSVLNTVQLNGVVASSILVGHYIIVNEHAAQGKSLLITAKGNGSGNSVKYTVTDADGDPDDVLNLLIAGSPGTRVSLGMRFFHNEIDNNLINVSAPDGSAQSGIAFGGTQLYSRIGFNTINGTQVPPFQFVPEYHLREDANGDVVAQCIFVRSLAGQGGLPKFSFQNSVVGNTCAGGDLSATVISWGTYEVNSPTWMDANTTGAGYNPEWRTANVLEPANDPWVPPS